ncbi:ComF family protein [Actinomyces faecalis]|uniref:ComF family protein n=1 Tax=Actinomyces faecalis TaxID=2722820 RepID=UPI001FD2ECE4|nr:phosphoribosyltransferase family protein [Actinomyces faecalis]
MCSNPPPSPSRPAPLPGLLPARLRPLASTTTSLLQEAASVLLPARCAGCGTWETRLCLQCRSLLAGPLAPVPQADGAGDLPVHALTSYTGPVRALVLGWKNGGREDLTQTMREAGERAGQLWPRTLEATTAGQIARCSRLLVVPAPSGPTRRLRGRLVAADLADAVARGLARAWPEHADLTVLSTDLLRRAPQIGAAHQSGRSARRRRSNRARPPRVLAPVAGLPVLLVDDVVTTGSTLGSCARALESAGAWCVGALVLAAAPSPRAQVTVVPGR